MIEMFGNQCVNIMMNNILTFHFTDYSLKQKKLNPLFFHIDRDFILDVTERCDSISVFRMVESPVR